MKTTVKRIVIEVHNGAVQAVYGDKLKTKEQIEFIVRDWDNINAGDPDPVGFENEPEVRYW